MKFRRWGEAAYISIQSPKNHPTFDQFSYFTTLGVCAITILPSDFFVDHHHQNLVQYDSRSLIERLFLDLRGIARLRRKILPHDLPTDVSQIGLP